MGSPITLSGFNKIDFNLILNAIMEQERAPIRSLETQKKALETQNTAFGTFAGKLATFENAIEKLADVTSLANLAATSSDTSAVGVSTTSGTVEGTYDVVVTELAKAQVTASTSTYASVDAEVATSGTLSMLVAGSPPVNIVVTGSMSLKQIAAAINAKSDAPVSASVVQAAPGQYRLVLTGKSTGADNAFTMTSTLSGGQGLTFADSDADGVYGDSLADNSQKAINASLTVNNLAISSATNTVEDVIPGAVLTLLKKDAGKTVTVGVTRDNEGSAELVDKFIGSYNDILTFLKEQNSAAASGKTSIGRDPVLRGLKDAVRSALQSAYGTGPYKRLAEVGLGFDISGALTLDKEVFNEALAASPTDVQTLFGGADGTGGVFGALKTLVQDYTESGGLVSNVRDRLTEQVQKMRNRLDSLESSLATRRAAMQQEFIAADLAMSRMNSQSSSLSQLGGQFRLF